MKYYLFIVSLLFANLSFSQNNKQNIRGTVIDKFSQSPMIGASIQIVNNDIINGTQTDTNGHYMISGLIPNRYEIKITYIGYKDVVIPNVVVTSGKEVILDISMEEDLRLLDEVVVTAFGIKRDHSKLSNGAGGTSPWLYYFCRNSSCFRGSQNDCIGYGSVERWYCGR